MKTHKEMMQHLINGDTLVNESKQDIKLQDNGMVQMFSSSHKYDTIITFKPKNWNIKMKIDKLEQLLKQKAEIEEQIKLIEEEKLKQKWEPVGGDYYVCSDGEVDQCHSIEGFRLFGTERQTQEQAEKARDKMRVFNRLLAYQDEFCADYEFVKNKNNYFVYFDENNKIYDLDYNDAHYTLGVVYFNYEIARELAGKLNSGVVEL